MSESVEYYAFFISEIIVPLFVLMAGIFALWVTYKKGVFKQELVRKKGEIEENNIPKIVGDHNTIHLTATDMQKAIAYDVDRFDEYHQQSINQSKISFWFSLLFASVGFVIIATSLWDENGYTGIVAGAVIDAVSALFFYQSNKARQLMSEFFDRLRSDRKLEESLKLCDSIDNASMRNALKVKLSMYFAGIESSDEITSNIIGITAGSEQKDKKED